MRLKLEVNPFPFNLNEVSHWQSNTVKTRFSLAVKHKTRFSLAVKHKPLIGDSRSRAKIGLYANNKDPKTDLHKGNCYGHIHFCISKVSVYVL